MELKTQVKLEFMAKTFFIQTRIYLLILIIFCIGCDSYHKEYYENGELKSIGKFENENRYGEWFFFTSEGDTSEVHVYENGKIIKKDKYLNGNLFLSESLKNGERDGEIIAYYPDGSIRSRGFYKNGVEDGKFSAYYENGLLKAKGKIYETL